MALTINSVLLRHRLLYPSKMNNGKYPSFNHLIYKRTYNFFPFCVDTNKLYQQILKESSHQSILFNYLWIILSRKSNKGVIFTTKYVLSWQHAKYIFYWLKCFLSTFRPLNKNLKWVWRVQWPSFLDIRFADKAHKSSELIS